MEDRLGFFGRCYNISCIQRHLACTASLMRFLPASEHLAINFDFTLDFLPHTLASGCLTRRVASGSFVFSIPLWLVSADFKVLL